MACFKSGVFEPLNTVKLTPSKRASPSTVANQRYLSAVCAMARTESCGNPFEVVQTSWPNCVRASLGSRPQAGTDNRPIANRLAGRSVTILISAAPSQTLIRNTPAGERHRHDSPSVRGKRIPDIKVVESMAASSSSNSRGSRWLHIALAGAGDRFRGSHRALHLFLDGRLSDSNSRPPSNSASIFLTSRLSTPML